MHSHITIAIVSTIVWAGCVNDPEDPAPDPPIITPTFDGKSDAGGRVDLKGRLWPDAGAEGELVEDLEFHGFVFELSASDTVDLEVTQRGSTRGLNTSLFVFGPADGLSYGTSALARDSNAGWGTLSRIAGLALAPGRYLAVVGTADGAGRGHYRLTLGCATGACAPADGLRQACPEEIAAWVDGCLADVTVNQHATEREALAICRSPMWREDALWVLCDHADDGSDPDYCADDGEDRLKAHLSNCFAGATDDIETMAMIDLTHHPIGPRLERVLDQGYEACGGFCGLDIQTLTHAPIAGVTLTTEPLIRKLVEAETIGRRNGQSTIEHDASAAFLDMLFERDMHEVIALGQALSGSEAFLVGSVYSTALPTPSTVEINHDFVVLFPETHWIVTITTAEFIDTHE